MRAMPCLIVLSLLTACSTHPPLAEPGGAFRALNAGRWTPTADDLTDPHAPTRVSTVEPRP